MYGSSGSRKIVLVAILGDGDSYYSRPVPHIAVNDLELSYETAGDPNDPPLLLIAGLGVQLIDWAAHFVDPLVERGLFVIRYDNRDIGLSTTFEGGEHDPQAVLDAVARGDRPNIAYTLDDMADDAAGLLDALGIESAHIAGVSMGGMIAQATAIRHPLKVRSLTSIMSTTGAADVGYPTPEAMEAILSSAPGTERQDIISHNMRSAKVWASPDQLRRCLHGEPVPTGVGSRRRTTNVECGSTLLRDCCQHTSRRSTRCVGYSGVGRARHSGHADLADRR